MITRNLQSPSRSELQLHIRLKKPEKRNAMVSMNDWHELNSISCGYRITRVCIGWDKLWFFSKALEIHDTVTIMVGLKKPE